MSAPSSSSSSSETYSSYMARLAQTAFRNTMQGNASPLKNQGDNGSQSTSVSHRPPPPPPPSSSRPQQQQESSNYQSIMRAAPGANSTLQHQGNQIPPRSPPPPVSYSTNSRNNNNNSSSSYSNNNKPYFDIHHDDNISNSGAATAIQSSATEFLDTLSEREKLYTSPYRQKQPPLIPAEFQQQLLQTATAAESSSGSSNRRFFPSDFNPQRKNSALWSALDSLKQTPIARSGAGRSSSNNNENTMNNNNNFSTTSSAASFGDQFAVANNRLSTSQSFSTTSRISKYLLLSPSKNENGGEAAVLVGEIKNDNDDQENEADGDDSRVADLFSNNNTKNDNTHHQKKKSQRLSEIESLRKQMTITNHPSSLYSSSSSFSNSNRNHNNATAQKDSLAANIARSTEAQRKQHLDQERVLDSIQNINVIEQRLTDHQNEHTKLRAQRLMDVDRARWEVQRVDFRVLEVQAQMDAACAALQERLLSRLATVKQLQDDAVKQNEMRLQSAVKGEHDRRIASFREQTAERASTVGSLRVALQQLAAHVEVQSAQIEHDISRRSVNSALDRLNAIRHSLSAGGNRMNASVESMVTMVQNFAVETKKQLAELKEERMVFQERMAKRTEEMRAARLATDARHSRKVATASSFRAPSI